MPTYGEFQNNFKKLKNFNDVKRIFSFGGKKPPGNLLLSFQIPFSIVNTIHYNRNICHTYEYNNFLK